MYYLIAAVYVLVCLVMLFAILLQQGKGGDIASAFGGGSSQAAFGARTGATVLSKITAGAAALFMVLALAMSILGQRGPGSVVSGTPAPKPPASTPAPATPQTPASAPAQQQAPATTPAAPVESAPAQTPPAKPPSP
jgi:preprotein translocase subunit SecG